MWPVGTQRAPTQDSTALGVGEDLETHLFAKDSLDGDTINHKENAWSVHMAKRCNVT